MTPSESIFVDFNLPNPTTWFYFSLLLAVALLFKFSRLLSVRNLDLALIFLPVPGLLLILEGGMTLTGEPRKLDLLSRWGFVWLLIGSLLLLIRCLWDLALERRPALSPNLSSGGLAWLASALFLSLIAVSVRDPARKEGGQHRQLPFTKQVALQGEATLGQLADDDMRHWVVHRTLALMSHLAVVVGLVFIAWRHFRDVHAGMAAATLYLLLPYNFLLMPYAKVIREELQSDGSYAVVERSLDGQWHDVWPTALLIWALALYKRPTLAGLLFGVAIASVTFPILLVPLWLSFYWRRGAGRFLLGCALGGGLCVGWLLGLAWLSGDWPQNLGALWPIEPRDWLPWPSDPIRTPCFWLGFHRAYRLPVFLLYVVLVAVTSFWPAPKNLAHLIALSAALLLGTQLWYADRGGIQILWYLPLLLLMAFRPNLSQAQAPTIAAETDWLLRLRRKLTRTAKWLLRRPEPMVPSEP